MTDTRFPAADELDFAAYLFQGALDASGMRRSAVHAKDAAAEALASRLAEIDEGDARDVKFSAINRQAARGGWLLAEVSPGPGAPWWHVAVVECGTGMVAYTRRAVHRDGVRIYLAKERVNSPDFHEKAATESDSNPFHYDPVDPSPRVDTRCVYFIQPVGGGLIKIGVAGWPKLRLAAIQHMSPVPLRLLGEIPGVGQAEETRLHARFADIREHGEWFRPAAELLAYIAEHAQT
jgi:hypothetical protein